MEHLPEELNKLLAKLNVQHNAPMAQYTSFKVGGPARILVEPDNAEDIAQLLRLMDAAGVKYYIIGNGTNLLISDNGLDAIVVRIGEKLGGIEAEGSIMRLGAGASFSAAAKQSVQNGFMGLEWAAGIPGSVGGAIAMNAGAYGGETVNVLKSVTYIENGKLIKESITKSDFGYRRSPYCAPQRLIIGAEFELQKDDGGAYARLLDYSAKRKAKQPLNYPSAGSTFKRPQGNFAGALIEQAGLKGKTIGAAQVSELHAGFIINAGGATARDIYALIKYVEQSVLEHSGVKLELEVKLLGDF